MLKHLVNKFLALFGLTLMSANDIKFMISHEINHHEYRRLFPKKDLNLVNIGSDIVLNEKIFRKPY